MKITKIETLRTAEFANVIWVRVHTDAGWIGLGETFYGAGAVEAHIHDTLAGRLLGRNPLQAARAVERRGLGRHDPTPRVPSVVGRIAQAGGGGGAGSIGGERAGDLRPGVVWGIVTT